MTCKVAKCRSSPLSEFPCRGHSSFLDTYISSISLRAIYISF